MNQTTCESCAYFHQHYVLGEKRIFQAYCGHCTFEKTKRKHPDKKACENYVPGQRDEAAFVSKEYLSKVMLEYMMKLELLPEIENLPEKSENG